MTREIFQRIELWGVRDEAKTRKGKRQPMAVVAKTVLPGCEDMERMLLVADHEAGKLLPPPGTEDGIVAMVE